MNHFIPALNALDAILEKTIAEVGPRICILQASDQGAAPTAAASLEQSMVDEQIRMLKAVLRFTSKLLENSSSKSIYNSIEVTYYIYI